MLGLDPSIYDRSKQVVVLSDVLASEFVQGCEMYKRFPVDRCDGTKIKSLAHLAELVSRKSEEAFLRFDLADGGLIALPPPATHSILRDEPCARQFQQAISVPNHG